ncbi:MAG: acyl-CoA thioesterase [Candidatus Omnitrophica bacterium]|nr:acyl-CoA thioesterase [Candidatus Omnitrophota bacterium]
MKVKIHYHHTDCGGVVYYAKYLEFLEEARTEYFEEKGLFIKELVNRGIIFVVRHQDIKYLKPVFYMDTLEIKAKIDKVSDTRVIFDYDIRNQKGEFTTYAKTELVCVDKNFKLTKIPKDIFKKLCLTQDR